MITGNKCVASKWPLWGFWWYEKTAEGVRREKITLDKDIREAV